MSMRRDDNEMELSNAKQVFQISILLYECSYFCVFTIQALKFSKSFHEFSFCEGSYFYVLMKQVVEISKLPREFSDFYVLLKQLENNT